MNFEPLIEGIARIVGATGKVAAKEGDAAARGAGHTRADLERWLGPLKAPEKQVPLIHDYLRGQHAIEEARATGATHVREISVPVWESAQKYLQQKIDADPEVQDALRSIYVGRNTPKDPDVQTVLAKPEKPAAPTQSYEVPKDAPVVPQAKPARDRMVDAAAAKSKQQSWDEFAVAVESQDAPRIDAALERIRVLHEPENPANPTEVPGWQKALDYMASLEQQVQQMQAARVTNDAWTDALSVFREQSRIDSVPLPKHVRNTIDRFNAWADAQKPPTMADRFTQALGVPRSLMSSADLSAPGRQGLLMIARPEYRNNLRTMIESWDESKFLESQAYIRNHPDFPQAQDAGLALTDIHSKLAPREEAFQSVLAERIPFLGPKLVKPSQQAYTTFLNRLRLDVFSNELKAAAAAGVPVQSKEFQRSLAEWINTSTGRGGGKNFNPGVVSSILFSPRLGVSRFQTFNPWYYYKMHPYVRKQAIKSNLAAAAAVYGLVSFAGLMGAKVTWDFRNPDAGKVRIGDTRLDLGGGHYQWLRLYTQLVSGQKMNPDTGKITELGERFGAPTGLDLVTNFIISKEAPIASFVTDWLRGKETSGEKFSIPRGVLQRVVPLSIQDMTEVLRDQGVQGLLYAFPALVGIGVQTYTSKGAPEVVPFAGVKGEVPAEAAQEYAKLIQAADTIAATKAAEKTQNMGPAAARSVLRNFVRAERMRARTEWIKANRDSFVAAKKAGQPRTKLVAPAEQP